MSKDKIDAVQYLVKKAKRNIEQYNQSLNIILQDPRRVVMESLKVGDLMGKRFITESVLKQLEVDDVDLKKLSDDLNKSLINNVKRFHMSGRSEVEISEHVSQNNAIVDWLFDVDSAIAFMQD